MVLIISDQEVRAVLKMRDALEAVEGAFRELALGTAKMPSRTVITVEDSDGWVGIMPSLLKVGGALATKVVTVYKGNPEKHDLPTTMATIILNDPQTGKPLAILDGAWITAMRTGAASGVATKHLARRASRIAGVFGAGVQARTQLMAISEVCALSMAKVYDVSRERAEAYAKEMRSLLAIDIEVVRDPMNAVKGVDVICTATTSKQPVFKGEWLEGGVHINSVGSHTPDSRELDSVTMTRSKIIVDSREASLREAGDLIIPIREGELRAEDIYSELGDVAAGLRQGRGGSDHEITVFKSVGLAIQDASTALLTYTKARELGLGREVKL